MGCDFSSETKESFRKKILILKQSSSEVEKKQNKLKSSLREFKEITVLPTEKNNIIKDLENDLISLENILKEIRKRQVLKSSDTISIEKIQKSQERVLPPEIVTLQETKKYKSGPNRHHKDQKGVKSNNFQDKRESVSKLNQQSILNDPEIAALIAKNRKLLIRQLTR